MSDPAPPQIFDRGLINRRLDRAWARAGGRAQADFLLVRAAEDLRDRLSLVKRRFALAADFGSPGPHGAAALAAAGQVDCVIRVAPTEASRGNGDFLPAVGDLERLPTADGRLDLAVSLLALQTVNDLPGALIQIRRALKGDGLLIAALIGGETLTELRQSLTIAESEILGGASPRGRPVCRRARSRGPRAARGLSAAGRRSRSRGRPLPGPVRAFRRPPGYGGRERAARAQPQTAASRGSAAGRRRLR